MKKTGGTLNTLLSVGCISKATPPAVPKPITFVAKIDNIDFNKTAIDSDMKLLLADRFHFKTKTPVTRIRFQADQNHLV